MTIKTSTLRPGLLVSLKTSLSGNVKYAKNVLEDETLEDGAAKARWETERLISDPKEYDRAKKARSAAARAVRSICSYSAFGLLCPEDAAADLEKAIAKAREIADDFNTGAALTRIYVHVLTGRIAPDDVEAVKAINSEIRELLGDMERGVRNLNVEVIREAAGRAKDMGQMLSPDAQARINVAIEAARGAAKKIVQAGEQAAAEVDLRAIRAITESRTAFLDLDPAGEVQAPAQEQRSLDLAPAVQVAPQAPKTAALEL